MSVAASSKVDWNPTHKNNPFENCSKAFEDPVTFEKIQQPVVTTCCYQIYDFSTLFRENVTYAQLIKHELNSSHFNTATCYSCRGNLTDVAPIPAMMQMATDMEFITQSHSTLEGRVEQLNTELSSSQSQCQASEAHCQASEVRVQALEVHCAEEHAARQEAEARAVRTEERLAAYISTSEERIRTMQAETQRAQADTQKIQIDAQRIITEADIRSAGEIKRVTEHALEQMRRLEQRLEDEKKQIFFNGAVTGAAAVGVAAVATITLAGRVICGSIPPAEAEQVLTGIWITLKSEFVLPNIA